MARITTKIILAAILAGVCGWASPFVATASAQRLDEMSLERWGKLREAERYQLNIAEKYYREKQWKVAMAEYDKFMSLYESSEGAPYARLKWSHCLVHLRQLNTAISDGYQSVIDYWPEAPEAIAAKYYIGHTYKSMGDIKLSRQGYAKVLAEHSDHIAAVYTKRDLVDLAEIEKDNAKRVALWKDLTFDTPRTGDAKQICAEASIALARHMFYSALFEEGAKALATTYDENSLPYHVYAYVRDPVHHLTGDAEKKPKGEKEADQAVAFLKEKRPTDTSTDPLKERAKQFDYWIAEIHWYARRPAETMKVYEKMLETFGADDQLLGKMAEWFKSQNRRDEARQTFGRYKNQVEGQKSIAWMYREEGKHDDAIKIYQDLIAQDPGNTSDYQWWTAECYQGQRKYKEAIATYRQADKQYPENIKRMAECHRHLKEFNEAVNLYGQLMAEERSASWAMLQVAATYEQSGDKEKAIKFFQQVCKKFPKSGEASHAHAHLQTHYKITVTLGGATDE